MSISSTDTFIDPRDVEIEADEFNGTIEEKKDEIQNLEGELLGEDSIEEQLNLQDKIATAEDELRDIESEAEDILDLHEECENYARGSSLINEDCFTEYCEEFAYDAGEISRDGSMASYVDWDRFAEDCKMDYTTITFHGTDFYVHG